MNLVDELKDVVAKLEGKEVKMDAKSEEVAPTTTTTIPKRVMTTTTTTIPKPAVKTIEQLADEVMVGAYGSGRERMIVLGEQYEEVQAEVNKRIRRGDAK